MGESEKDKIENDDIFDEIGHWTEVKLDIVKRYAQRYSQILSNNPKLKHSYIDAFSGPGVNRRKISREFVLGSPLNALIVEPPFEHYYFIDVDAERTSFLKNIIGDRSDISIFVGDCNEVLLAEIYDTFKWESFRRALCLLDPYKLQLDWKVVETAGGLGTIDLFLNFPILDINRNLARKNPATLTQSNIERMDRFWGDHSWYELLFAPSPDLFEENREQKIAKANKVLIDAYIKKLKSSGFTYVPRPIPMKNSKGGVVYYLFFATKKPVAKDIVEYIFNKFGKT